MSASKIPTLCFIPAAAKAILTFFLCNCELRIPAYGCFEALPAVVDLPTPPFPEATTTTFFTPAIGIFLGNPRCALGIVGAGLCRGNPCLVLASIKCPPFYAVIYQWILMHQGSTC